MRACLLWLVLMLASPCGLAIDAVRGMHQLQHSSWTARDGAPDDIAAMAQGHDGFLWLGTHSGLIRFDGLRFEPVAARQGRYPDTVALALRRAQDGGMWVGWQVGGISHVKDGVVRNYGEAQGLRAGTIWGFAVDGAGALWAAGASGVARFDGRRWQTMGPAQGFTASKGSAVFADRDGRLGVFSERGLFLWQPAQGRFAPPIGKLDLRAPPQQGPDGRLYLLEWRGIRIIDSLERYDQLDHPWIYRDTSGTSGSMVVDRQGTLWFDSQYGLHRTRSAGTLAPRQFGISGDTESFLPRDGLGNALIGALCEDNEGNIWVATYAGLDRFRQAAPGEPEAFRAQEVLAGPDDAMWLAGGEGMPLVLARADGTLLRTFKLAPVSGMMTSPQGLWIAVPSGLRQIDPASGRALRSIAYPPEARAIGRTRQIASARDGSLWLNTANGAVHVAANEVAQALRDASYRLRARIYDAGDGVVGKIGMLHSQSLAEADDGRIWFSRQSVTFWIDPRRPPASLPAARVEIGAIWADGVDASTFQDRLPAGTRDLQFTYNASSLGTPSRLQFHYLLEGYDQQWHSAGSRRQVQYTGLGPGRYRFKVMAFNGDGVASPVAQLPLRVLPAFHQTWWFRALSAAALLAALYAAFRWRLQRHGARLQARLEAQQAERERIARELHDTLLQGTQAVILHFHNASMALPAHEPARHGMLRALDAADRMLEEGRDQVQGLRAGGAGGAGDPASWSAILRREGERLATLHGVAFRYLESGTPHALQAAASHEIGRIASEALRNAFMHARAELVELEVRHAHSGVQVDVRDDGQGLPPVLAAGGQLAGHWGLPSMRERAAALGAELALIRRESGGTHWRLRVPGKRRQRWKLRRRVPARSGLEDAAP